MKPYKWPDSDLNPPANMAPKLETNQYGWFGAMIPTLSKIYFFIFCITFFYKIDSHPCNGDNPNDMNPLAAVLTCWKYSS